MSNRLLVYDATDTKTVAGKFYSLGAVVFSHHFDVVHGAESVEDAMRVISSMPWEEVQVWGHGRPGGPMISNREFSPLDNRWRKIGLVWFRSCSVFRGVEGAEFANLMSRHNGIGVAGHTYEIGTWGLHSGLYALRPKGKAWWNVHEKGVSRPFARRTIAATRMSLPDWAFEK
jgi:hypothetical protein